MKEYGYEPGFISNSMMQCHSMCSWKYKQIYLHNVKEPKYLNAANAGTLVHEILEDYPDAESYFLHGWRLANELLDDCSKAAFSSFWSDCIEILDSRKDISSPSKCYPMRNRAYSLGSAKVQHPLSITPKEFCETIVVALYNYQKHFQKQCLKEFPKREVVLKYQSSIFNLVGSLDLYSPSESEVVKIGDFKTGIEKWTEQKIKNSDQFNLYLTISGAESAEVSVFDLRRGKRIDATLTRDSIEYFGFYDRLIFRFEDIEGGKKSLPSSSSLGCPCFLAYLPEDKEAACPYYSLGDD